MWGVFWRKQGDIGMWGEFWDAGNVLYIGSMAVIQMYTFVKIYQTTHLRLVDMPVCKLCQSKILAKI